jgi:hypothetical protein
MAKKINWIPKENRWNANAYRPDDFSVAVGFVIDFINRHGTRVEGAAIKSVSAWRKLNHLALKCMVKHKRRGQRQRTQRVEGQAQA